MAIEQSLESVVNFSRGLRDSDEQSKMAIAEVCAFNSSFGNDSFTRTGAASKNSGARLDQEWQQICYSLHSEIFQSSWHLTAIAIGVHVRLLNLILVWHSTRTVAVDVLTIVVSADITALSN